MPNQEGAELKTSKATNAPHRIRSPSGTNEHDTHKQSRFSDIRFQKYVVKSFCMSGYTSSLCGNSCASRETSLLSVQLAENNPGPVGPEYNSGLHDRLRVTATSTISTPASTILCGADTADLHGDHRTSPEKCNRRSDIPSKSGLLFESLSCPQRKMEDNAK